MLGEELDAPQAGPAPCGPRVRLPINECTPPYQRVYACLSTIVRLLINECTPPYQRVYARGPRPAARQDVAHHVIQRTLHPQLLSPMAP
jgi:hypothetical protein